MANVILAFGANLGDTNKTFKEVFRMLDHYNLRNIKLSSLYKSKSFLLDEQPDYYNMVGLFSTEHSPLELLNILKNIENVLGRTDTGRWKERLIDIDIIDYDLKIYKYDNLDIPHISMQDRSFVVIPLMEIYPDYVHPKFNKRIKDIADNLSVELNLECLGQV